MVFTSRYLRMNRRQGVLYQIDEHGTARLIFDEEKSSFTGVLETGCGEIISLRGKSNANSASNSPKEEAPTTSSHLMEVYVVDGEAGNSFQLENVPIVVENGMNIHINHSAISFSSVERLVGMKADQEIRQFMNPSMFTDGKSEVFVGPMKVQVVASKRTNPGVRRESTCDIDVKILEQSDDFLA